MLREFKTFVSEHRDIIFSLVLLIAVDSFFLHGALKAKLESLLHKLTDKATERLENAANTKN